jgi:hypothetical protein
VHWELESDNEHVIPLSLTWYNVQNVCKSLHLSAHILVNARNIRFVSPMKLVDIDHVHFLNKYFDHEHNFQISLQPEWCESLCALAKVPSSITVLVINVLPSCSNRKPYLQVVRLFPNLIQSNHIITINNMWIFFLYACITFVQYERMNSRLHTC